MALKRNERYPNRFDAPDAAHPQGAFKNRTTDEAQDGSYLDRDWANDWDGFFAKLLKSAGIVANGTVDSALASQYYDALVAVMRSTGSLTYLPLAGGTLTGKLDGTSSEFSGSVTQRESIVNYRQVISRTDAGTAYTLYNRVDQVEGVLPATATIVGEIVARLTTVAGSTNGRMLGSMTIRHDTGGGGNTYIGARDAVGVDTSSLEFYGDRGEATLKGKLTADGEISTTKSITGNGVYDGSGNRCYSPNNPPPLQSGATVTGNHSAYYTHANGQIFMQAVGNIDSDSTVNPEVIITLPASFPNGITAVTGSFSGTGGQNQDSHWTVISIGKNQIQLHTTNCSGKWAFIVAGY